MCVGAQALSRVWLCVSPWTVALQALLSGGILQARTLEWVAISSSRGYSWPRLCSAIFLFFSPRVLLLDSLDPIFKHFPFTYILPQLCFTFLFSFTFKIFPKTCHGFWLDSLCPRSPAFTPTCYLIPVLPPIPLIRSMRQCLSHLNNKLGVFLPVDHCLLFEVDSHDDSPQLLQEPPYLFPCLYFPQYSSDNSHGVIWNCKLGHVDFLWGKKTLLIHFLSHIK